MLDLLAWFFDGQQACISDSTDAETTWHCTDRANTTCDSSSNVCYLSDGSWAWDGPAYKSIVSEWALDCANYFIKGLPTSCFYFGCLVGGFVFATLADSSLGRKNLLVLSCLIMSSAALATSFYPGVWVYSALRFASGFGRASIGTCAVVLSTEMVAKNLRGLLGMIGLFMNTLGLLPLPAIAYLLRDASWRYLYVATSVPALIYTLVTFFLGVPKMASHVRPRQGSPGDADKIRATVEARPTQTAPIEVAPQARNNETRLYSSIKYILERQWASTWLLKVMALGFGTGMMDYGMLLVVGNLDRWKRRDSVLSFAMLSGLLSIICAVGGSGSLLELGFELTSFFCTCVAYKVLLIYTIELFPTRVRNSATSMMRQAVILGVLLDPTLIAAGRDVRYLTFLPETRGVTLWDTLDE
ncbi:LOW QUALITY PROTEIN: hypothetical protein BT93_F2142 [Corymbia citriodora subsp. variegata]|nr:LOW QUALITY PROTEIN: hypothetical protein BT93_F2142 [Corymbia citriodora subsp. variegata]